jgi:Flp pilus assembly protein TadB
VTAPKGRPTPKRSQSKARGPVAPAPMTSAEARKRKKANRQKLTKEERKADKAARRSDMAVRREKMMAGDDAYLLPRDKGPVRRYARDVVDARRNLLGLFMPAALAVVFVMLSMPSVQIQMYVQFVMLALVLVMIVDGVLIGRRVNRLVNEKFPDNTEGSWKLGFYAASRASQLRRMRAPRPQVERGTKLG